MFDSSHCPLQHPQVTVIDSREQLRQTREAIAGDTGPGNRPLSNRIGGSDPGDSLTRVLDRLLERQDFDSSQLILFARGQQPNPGYGLRIDGRSARWRDAHLQLPLYLSAPAPDTVQAQMTVSPCMLLSVATRQPIHAVTPEP